MGVKFSGNDLGNASNGLENGIAIKKWSQEIWDDHKELEI